MGESSSETNVPVSEWTTGTLKIYHDDKILSTERIAAAEFNRIDGDISRLNILLNERSVAQEKAVIAALTAAQEAVDKSERASEKRFDAVAEKIADISDRLNRSDGVKTGSDLTIGKISTVVGIVGGISTIVILFVNGVFK